MCTTHYPPLFKATAKVRSIPAHWLRGDTCHVPVLVWLPALASPLPATDAVRFSLQYVDALKIDHKTVEVCGVVSRPGVRARPDS